MRKLLTLAATLALISTLAFLALPAGAAAPNSCAFGGPPPTNGNSMTSTCTSNFHNAAVPFAIPEPCPPVPGGIVFTSANGVLHATSNASPGFWITGTLTGDFDLFAVDASGNPIGPSIGSGHGTAWFGVEDQQKSFVTHATTNGVVTSSTTGQTGEFHANFDMTFNANMMPTANVTNIHCT